MAMSQRHMSTHMLITGPHAVCFLLRPFPSSEPWPGLLNGDRDRRRNARSSQSCERFVRRQAPFETPLRERWYTLSMIGMHARVGWLLVQRSAKRLVADDRVLLVEMTKGR